MNPRAIIPFGITASILWLGFQAILAAFDGAYAHAAQLILLGGLLDGIDGEVARRVRGATLFGERLDSYVDVVCFGVAPAYLAYEAFWGQFGVLGACVAFVYVLSGVVRFSRSGVTQDRGHRHYFRGLPIPVNAMWISMYMLVSHSSNAWVEQSGPSYDLFTVFAWASSLAFAVLQVSNVQYVKASRDSLLLAVSSMLVLMLLTRRPAPVFAATFFITLTAYAFVGPLLARRARRIAAEEEEEEPAPEHR